MLVFSRHDSIIKAEFLFDKIKTLIVSKYFEELNRLLDIYSSSLYNR